MAMPKQRRSSLEYASQKLTHWIGTPHSIIVHTIFFAGIFLLAVFDVNIDQILLILTTAVSLEAIYLSIFIQMSVNRTTKSLAGVEKDIDDIQEDVEDIGEDIDDIQVDVQGLSEDQAEEDQEEDDVAKALNDIEKRLSNLQEDMVVLKKKGLF